MLAVHSRTIEGAEMKRVMGGIWVVLVAILCVAQPASAQFYEAQTGTPSAPNCTGGASWTLVGGIYKCVTPTPPPPPPPSGGQTPTGPTCVYVAGATEFKQVLDQGEEFSHGPVSIANSVIVNGVILGTQSDVAGPGVLPLYGNAAEMAVFAGSYGYTIGPYESEVLSGFDGETSTWALCTGG